MKHFPLKPTCNNRTGNQIRWWNFQAQNQRTDSCQKKRSIYSEFAPYGFPCLCHPCFGQSHHAPCHHAPCQAGSAMLLTYWSVSLGLQTNDEINGQRRFRLGIHTTIKHEQNLIQSIHVKNGKTFLEFFFFQTAVWPSKWLTVHISWTC